MAMRSSFPAVRLAVGAGRCPFHRALRLSRAYSAQADGWGLGSGGRGSVRCAQVVFALAFSKKFVPLPAEVPRYPPRIVH